MSWLSAHWFEVLGASYVIINEVIALAPNLKSNSVLQLVLNILKSVVHPEPPK